MENRVYKNGGYIGLISLLLSVAIIFFVIWRFGPSSKTDSSSKNVIEQDLQAIEQANLLKESLEQNNRQMFEEIGL